MWYLKPVAKKCTSGNLKDGKTTHWSNDRHGNLYTAVLAPCMSLISCQAPQKILVEEMICILDIKNEAEGC